MDILDSRFAVRVCANSDAERARGVALFERLFGAAQVWTGVGTWQEYHEPSVEVEFWFSLDDWDAIEKVKRALRYCRLWQVAAKQIGIMLSVSTPAGAKSLVVYVGDWEEAVDVVLPLVDRAEYLVRYFESVHGAE